MTVRVPISRPSFRLLLTALAECGDVAAVDEAALQTRRCALLSRIRANHGKANTAEINIRER